MSLTNWIFGRKWIDVGEYMDRHNFVYGEAIVLIEMALDKGYDIDHYIPLYREHLLKKERHKCMLLQYNEGASEDE